MHAHINPALVAHLDKLELGCSPFDIWCRGGHMLDDERVVGKLRAVQDGIDSMASPQSPRRQPETASELHHASQMNMHLPLGPLHQS